MTMQDSKMMVMQDGRVIDTKYHADYAMPIPRPKLTRPVWLERQLKLGVTFVSPTGREIEDGLNDRKRFGA